MKQGTKDFLSIVIPSLQLLLLGVLTALFTANLDRFRAGIDESKMINELVMDLSKDSTKSNLKADFVMLSLERYLKRTHSGELKDYDRDMLVGFAKSIIINRLNSKDSQSDRNTNDMRIPKEILKKYDSTNVKFFIMAVSEINMTPTKNDTSEVLSISRAKPVRELENPSKKMLFNVLVPKSVYIQFNSHHNEPSVDSIRIAFQAQNWNSPGLEYRKGSYKNSIRYFHPEDISLVDEASKILEPYKYRSFQKILLSGYDKVPKGQIEIWINNK